MKSSLRAGGAAFILGTLILAGRSWSEPKKPPIPRTRIAVVNLSHVMKRFQKYQDLQAEIQSEIKKIQDKEKEFLLELKEVANAMADPRTPADKKPKYEKYMAYMKDKRDGNIDRTAAIALGKKSDDGMVALYKEVQQAVERYARANDIELVLQFNDADEKHPLAQSWNAENVELKMQASPCRPLSVAPGIDISMEIITVLNGGSRDK